MKTLTILIFAFLFHITGAETFKSHSTVMSVKDSIDIKTKKLFIWTDWSLILPADDTHQVITVKKNKVSFEGGDVYTLDKIVKRRIAQVRHELGAIFVYNATDQKGKKWMVIICRTDRIYAIQIEDSNKIIVYQ
jgi:hypothetical protein